MYIYIYKYVYTCIYIYTHACMCINIITHNCFLKTDSNGAPAATNVQHLTRPLPPVRQTNFC